MGNDNETVIGRKVLDAHLSYGESLYFSQRHAVDVAFREYCRQHGLQYCILNFLSWVVVNVYGGEIIKRLQHGWEVHGKREEDDGKEG